MSQIQSYRDLLVWQQAMDLAVSIYDLTRDWPRDELHGLTSQSRRAAVSIAANIAEGYGRGSRSYVSFLRIATGSLKELETQLLIAQRVGHSGERAISPRLEQCESIGKLLRALILRLDERE
jgi:four helix bundle protein